MFLIASEPKYNPLVVNRLHTLTAKYKYQTMKNEVWMRQAIRKAKWGMKRGQTPFGACLVRKGRVIACVSNVVWKTTDITAHAEIYAIRTACKRLKTVDLSECTLYSTCEPCPMCFSACHWAGIKTVYYGVGIRDANKIGFNELSIGNKKMGGYA